jgi:hypothetical protein
MKSDLETKLAECAEAAGKATPGPWHLDYCESTALSNQSHPVLIESAAFHRMLANGEVGADAPFAVAARNLPWPALLAAVRLAEACVGSEVAGEAQSALHREWNAKVTAVPEAERAKWPVPWIGALGPEMDARMEATNAALIAAWAAQEAALLAFRAAKQQEKAGEEE